MIESAGDKKNLLMDTDQVKKIKIYSKPRKRYWSLKSQAAYDKAEFKYEKFGIMLKNLNPKECVIYDLITSCYLLYTQLSNGDPFSFEFKEESSHTSLLLKELINNTRVIELTNSKGNSEVIVFPLVRECHEISLDFKEFIDE